jgi:hypothetical protein
MKRLLDCMVSYYGLDEKQQPGFRRYFVYHILAGPGPAAGTGVALIATLAVHDRSERCDTCEHFHTAATGGPAAALEAAVRYLDAYHREDGLRKVESDVRYHSGDVGARDVPTRTAG